MRILAIGDIHGCSRALDLVLAAVKPRPEDRIITLGDYVDRGLDSCGVLDRLIELQQTGCLVALRGNHDQMMLDARDQVLSDADWFSCGGRETLASYGRGATLADVPAAHWDFLENVLVDWHETATHFFVHANADSELPLEEQPRHLLLWEKLDNPRPHVSGKVMICGHTRQLSGEPLNLGHTICLDTWVYGQGWLTCLDVTSGQIWQANQLGQQWWGFLEEPRLKKTHHPAR
jgi:serine/threonine protein phosphatase 1